MSGKFNLRMVACTSAIEKNMSATEIFDMVKRHHSGDWGEMCQEDKELNEEALKTGERLHSSYTNTRGEKVWVITEWDRSVTTVLYPDEL